LHQLELESGISDQTMTQLAGHLLTEVAPILVLRVTVSLNTMCRIGTGKWELMWWVRARGQH